MMVLRIVSLGEVVHQAVTLVRQGERWLFRCPVSGRLTPRLYGNAGRFGALEAQHLVQGLDRPPEQDDTEVPIVAANWKPDEGPLAWTYP